MVILAIVLVYHLSLEDELSFIGSVLLFNMANYIFREYFDMLLLYGEAQRNERAALRLYEEHFSTLPDIFTCSLCQGLPEGLRHRYIHCQQVRLWCSMAAPYPEWEEAVLHEVEENVTTSTQQVACRLNVDQKNVWSILHNQQLHRYHLQRVQAMCPKDFVP